MAKSYKTFLLFMAAMFLSTLNFSCQEGGEAGELFGQWRLTGSDKVYLSFSGSVTRLRSTTEGLVFGNFQHTGDSLFIQCYSINGSQQDTTLVENIFGWKPFNDIRLKIIALDDDNLTLSSGQKMWSFYKY